MARLKAEGEAQHASRRLAVAQEQLAEYAAQKEMDAAVLLQQAQQLEALLQNSLQVRCFIACCPVFDMGMGPHAAAGSATVTHIWHKVLFYDIHALDC